MLYFISLHHNESLTFLKLILLGNHQLEDIKRMKGGYNQKFEIFPKEPKGEGQKRQPL